MKKILVLITFLFLFSQNLVSFAATSVGGGQSFDGVYFEYKGTGGTLRSHWFEGNSSNLKITLKGYHKDLKPTSWVDSFIINFSGISNGKCVTKSLSQIVVGGDGKNYKQNVLLCKKSANSIEISHITLKQYDEGGEYIARAAQSHGIINVSKILNSTQTSTSGTSVGGGQIVGTSNGGNQLAISESTRLKLSSPFTSNALCKAKKEFNDLNFPGNIRSACFENRNTYYYFLCAEDDDICLSEMPNNGSTQTGPINNSNNVTTNSLDGNPYTSSIDGNILAKLKVISKKLDAFTIANLKLVLTKLDNIASNYEDDKVIKDIIGYLRYDINQKIETKYKNSNVDDFFCALTGDCTEPEEENKIVSFETPKGPGGGLSIWNHSIDFTDKSVLKITVDRENENLEIREVSKTFILNYASLDNNECSDYKIMTSSKTISGNRPFKTYMKFCKKVNNKLGIYHRVEWEDNNWNFSNDSVQHGIIELKLGAIATNLGGFVKLDDYTNASGEGTVVTTDPVEIDRSDKRGGYTEDLFTNSCKTKNTYTNSCSCSAGYQSTQTVAFGGSGDSNFECFKIVSSTSSDNTCTLNKGFFLHNSKMYFTHGEGDYCKMRDFTFGSTNEETIEKLAKKYGKIVQYGTLPGGMTKNKGTCGYGLAKGNYEMGYVAYEVGQFPGSRLYSNGVGSYCVGGELPAGSTKIETIPPTMAGGKICGEDPHIANSCDGGEIYKVSGTTASPSNDSGGTLVNGGYTTNYSGNCTRANSKTGGCTCSEGFTPTSTVTIIGENRYNCSKVVASIDGACGSVNGKSVSVQPTSNLCNSGNIGTIYKRPSGFLGDDSSYNISDGSKLSWSWSCRGIGTGKDAQCGASYSGGVAKKGVCGFPSSTDTQEPTGTLCKVGSPKGVKFNDYSWQGSNATSNRWSWYCEGENYGFTPICTSLTGYTWNGTKWVK